MQIKPKAAPFRERLAFLVTDFTDDKASLDLEWEKLRLSIPIGVDDGEAGGGEHHQDAVTSTWRTYANAARYMLENKKDYDAGMKYIDQSLALKEDWYNLLIKAQLLAAKGNYKEAAAAGREGERARIRSGARLLPGGRGQEGPRRVEEEGLGTGPSRRSGADPLPRAVRRSR